MKIYKGKRLGKIKDTGSDVEVTVEDDKGKVTDLKHHVYHSPTGFAWGYGGSGPADLAKSILWDYLGEEPQSNLYQEFKWKFVAGWKNKWQITGDEIKAWLPKIPQRCIYQRWAIVNKAGKELGTLGWYTNSSKKEVLEHAEKNGIIIEEWEDIKVVEEY